MPRYRARDAFGRGSTTVSLELPQLCSDCIEQAGALVGVGDLTAVEADRDEARAELARVAAERDRAVAEREDADDALKATAAFERLLSAAPSKRSKTAA